MVTKRKEIKHLPQSNNRMRSNTATLSVAFAALLVIAGLQACLVGPKLQDPDIVTEEQYRFDSTMVDTIGDILWWELFPDTNLHNLVRIALTENKIVQQAVSRIEEARATVGFRRADQYPKFNGQISYTRGNLFQGNNINNAQNQFVIAPAFNWEIDFWGKYRHATRAAKQEMLASQYGQRVILLDLVSSVVANYILLLQYENQRQIAVSTLDSRRESTRIIQARYDRGTVAEIDLNQAQIQEEIAAASIPFFERQMAITENTLAILLGRNPRTILKGDFDSLVTPPIIPPGLPSELLVRRPDLMQQYHLLAAQNEYVGVAVANRLPNISLNGLFGVASNDIGMLFTGDGVVWSIGGSILQPIFQFGKNLRRVDIEKARLQQQLKQYENTVIEAFAEVEDALVKVETYDRELDARVRQRTAADNANRLSKMRYDGGQTSYLEVLEQERSLFDAELSTSEVHAQYLLSYVDLYRALGGGWLTEEEKEASEAIERAIEAELREREN